MWIILVAKVSARKHRGLIEETLPSIIMWHRKVCVSVCTLNQWALDFTGNLRRIIKSMPTSTIVHFE